MRVLKLFWMVGSGAWVWYWTWKWDSLKTFGGPALSLDSCLLQWLPSTESSRWLWTHKLGENGLFLDCESSGYHYSVGVLRSSQIADYLRKDKKKLSKFLKMEEVGTNTCEVFVGHGYLQHFKGDWKGRYLLQYPRSMTLEGVDLKDGEAFAHWTSLGRRMMEFLLLWVFRVV